MNVPNASIPPLPAQRRATRTYTGEALARRRAWGKLWGQRIKLATQQWKRELT